MLALFLLIPASNAFMQLEPYVTVSKYEYNVSSCSEEAYNITNYDETCLNIYNTQNTYPKCCYSLLETILNTSNFNFSICYPNGSSSILYNCNSHYDYLENRQTFIALGIFGILFLTFISIGLLYLVCGFINRGLFGRNRYQPV